MSICILNCVAMSPWFPRWHVGTPCLLVETDHGLVLVDTGLGVHDYTSPSRRVRFFRANFGIKNDPGLTAVRQLAQLGHQSEAVRHIVLTHLHFDHAGGLPDFPHAQVHTHRREYEALPHPRNWKELAYDRSDFAHGPRWVLYERPTAKWQGFDAIRLPFTPEMYLIPLFGHTRGHCGVAIQDGDNWLFQCGDALPTNAQFELLPNWLSRLVIGSHAPHLRAWAAAHPEARLLAGHMWQSFFEAHQAAQPWYHGSPLELTTIREGSTITQKRELARIFSHKPTLVSVSDDGQIKHNGTQRGYVYTIAERIEPDDVMPHPRTTMIPGDEWLTIRELRVELLCPTEVVPEEQLTDEELAALQEYLPPKK